MNKLEKLLYKADPSANATNKDALRAKFFPHADGFAAPRVKRNWVRPVLTASCVCFLLFGILSTDLAQAAINNVKEFFYIKEVVEPEEVSNDTIGFKTKNNNTETPVEEYTYSGDPLPKVQVSIEEAQNALNSPILLPKLPGDIYLSSITYSSMGGSVHSVEFMGETFRLEVFDAISLDGSDIKYTFPMKEEELSKYTVRDIEIYSFENVDGKYYLFAYDDFFYWFTAFKPLTDDEFVKIIDSLYQQ